MRIEKRETVKTDKKEERMRYSVLFAVTDLLNDVRLGREIKVNPRTKVDLEEGENYFKNLISDIDKDKKKNISEIMVYQLRIEVKK